MKLYETTFIIDPQLLEDGWEKSISRYSEVITRAGAIKRTDRWGLRRMSYPIKKRSQGYYVHIVHESSPAVPRELERQFLLDETCLRYLTVVADNPLYLEEMDRRRAAREEAGGEVHPPESSLGIGVTGPFGRGGEQTRTGESRQ